MKYSIKELGNRIKEERLKRKLSQDDLMAEMREKGNGIGKNTLSDLENGKAKDIKLSHILLICEIFDCDIDYFFGEITCKTHDTQFICDETGLSEEAVQKLKHFNYDRDVSSFINNLITHRDGNTVEGLAVTSMLIQENYYDLSKGETDGFDSHKLGNAIAGYLFECQSYLQRFVKEQYCIKATGEHKNT